jgi:signal peptidase II
MQINKDKGKYSMKNVILFFIVSGIVIMGDQVIKYLIRHLFYEGQSIDIIPHIVSFTYVQNNGAAFGFFQNSRLLIILVGLGSAIFILIELTFFCMNGVVAFGSALLFGGIVGNLIDRIFLGFVTDFIDFHFWPVFNIADASIDIGLAILLIYFIYHGEDIKIGFSRTH